MSMTDNVYMNLVIICLFISLHIFQILKEMENLLKDSVETWRERLQNIILSLSDKLPTSDQKDVSKFLFSAGRNVVLYYIIYNYHSTGTVQCV